MLWQRMHACSCRHVVCSPAAAGACMVVSEGRSAVVVPSLGCGKCWAGQRRACHATGRHSKVQSMHDASVGAHRKLVQHTVQPAAGETAVTHKQTGGHACAGGWVGG